jgi:hypothetical protein
MSLIYNAEADRLAGGDVVREVSGRLTASLVLSVRRGKLLQETLELLAAEYDRLPADIPRTDLPFARPVALFELHEYPGDMDGVSRALPVDALFARPELSLAPPEYRLLAQLVTLVPSDATLAAGARLSGGDALASFARQLFLTMGCGHCRANVSFSNSHGSCITEDALTSGGAFFDIYWFTRASAARDGLRMSQYDDVSRALHLVIELAGTAGADVDAVLELAATTYAQLGSSPTDVRRACRDALERLRRGAPQPLRDLAAAIRAGCC